MLHCRRPALALTGRVNNALQPLPRLSHAAAVAKRRAPPALAAAAAIHQQRCAFLPAAAPAAPHRQPHQHRCYVAPPSSGTASSTNSSSTSSGDPDPLEESPIVLVAGWLGAAERPFSKYVDLWQRRLGSSNVLQARPNPAALIVPLYGDASADRAASRLRSAAVRAPRAPILLHVFSGGGFLYSGLIMRALQRQGALGDVAPRMAGVILDSSPAFVTADVSSRALLAAALREPADGIDARHPRILGALRGAVDAYLSLAVTRRRLAGMERAWHELVPPCPKLYLYSESDVLVSPDVIQSHMQAEAVRGSRIYAQRWHDTPHVEHYRLHPEQYTDILSRFVSEALALAVGNSTDSRDAYDSSSFLSSGTISSAGSVESGTSSTIGSSGSGIDGAALSDSGSLESRKAGGGGGEGRSMWQREI